MELGVVLLILGLAVVVMVWPVQWAAQAMGARSAGFWRCLVALVAASVLHGLGLALPVAGTLIAFLLSALGFAAILRTTYLQGVGIAILQFVFGVLLVVGLSMLFGVSVAAILGTL